MDWATSFQGLSSKANSSYVTLLTQWQELLAKVSSGELTPAPLEDGRQQFLEDAGVEFYRRLSALSFEFFNGLSRLQGDCTEDFMRGLVGEVAVAQARSVPAPPPPPDAEADFSAWTNWYQALTAFLAEQNESALSRYQILLEKVANGRLTPAAVQEYSRKFMNERALVLTQDAGALQMQFYEHLIQLNQKFLENLLNSLVRKADGMTLTFQTVVERPTRKAVGKKTARKKRTKGRSQ